MKTLKYQPEYRRFLPHIQPPGATLFLTYRLAGTIPKHVHEQIIAEQEQTAKLLAQIENVSERARQKYREQKRAFGRYDQVLDKGQHGPAWLKEPQIAQLVADSLDYWDGRRYDLDSFIIMSNHVHVVFTPLVSESGVYYALATIMHSLKRYTARKANEVLGRNGRFWQPESYDHVVRDETELNRIRLYVLNNPVKAGLVESWEDWPWSWCRTG
ncbi:MAG: transposase [Anaerolineae bacterium]